MRPIKALVWEIRIAVCALIALASVSVSGQVYRCVDQKGMVEYKNFGDDIASNKGCKPIAGSTEHDALRNNLAVGDQTKEGLVIEIKWPIAKIQTSSGERWIRVDQLHIEPSKARPPKGASTPRFTPDPTQK